MSCRVELLKRAAKKEHLPPGTGRLNLLRLSPLRVMINGLQGSQLLISVTVTGFFSWRELGWVVQPGFV